MTEEKNESPAPKEPENPWAFLDSPPREAPDRDPDVLRLKDVSKSWLAGYILNKGCTFLVIIVGAIILGGTIFGEIEDRARLNKRYAFDCVSRLSQIGKGLYYLVDPDRKNDPSVSGQDVLEPPFELRPEHTIADLIREMLARGLLKEEDLRCRWGEGHPPYLVFPLPASVLVMEHDPKNRIPILMELPEFHRKSETFWKIWKWLPGKGGYVSSPRVLWADGGAGIISMEEAEKFMKEHPPEPIKFQDGSSIGQGKQDAADRQD